MAARQQVGERLASDESANVAQQFESQDILVPWRTPERSSSEEKAPDACCPCCETATTTTTTTTTSDEDVTHYHAYTQTSESDSCHSCAK